VIELKPNRFYRIIFSDRSELDFETIKVSDAKHLIEVRIKDQQTCKFIDILAGRKWIDIFEIIEEVGNL
jgi:hypothetical protein